MESGYLVVGTHLVWLLKNTLGRLASHIRVPRFEPLFHLEFQLPRNEQPKRHQLKNMSLYHQGGGCMELQLRGLKLAYDRGLLAFGEWTSREKTDFSLSISFTDTHTNKRTHTWQLYLFERKKNKKIKMKNKFAFIKNFTKCAFTRTLNWVHNIYFWWMKAACLSPTLSNK